MTLSNYAENAILNSLFGKTSDFGALASAPTLYVALSTADPDEDGSGMAEPSGNGYARVATADTDWNAAASSVVTNANTVQFPEATGPWGTATHFALFDASTSGNLIASGALTLAKAFDDGDTPSFESGDLSFTAN